MVDDRGPPGNYVGVLRVPRSVGSSLPLLAVFSLAASIAPGCRSQEAPGTVSEAPRHQMRAWRDEEGNFVAPPPGEAAATAPTPAGEGEAPSPTPRWERAPGGGEMLRLDGLGRKRAGSPPTDEQGRVGDE